MAGDSPMDLTGATTMADHKSMEMSMRLTMETKLNELQDLMLSLKAGKDPPEKPALKDIQKSLEDS